jgi:hypothetical protein
MDVGGSIAIEIDSSQIGKLQPGDRTLLEKPLKQKQTQSPNPQELLKERKQKNGRPYGRPRKPSAPR